MDDASAAIWARREAKAKAIREMLLIVAIVVGGGWALYRFVAVDSAGAKQRYEEALALAKANGLQIDIAGAAETLGGVRHVRGAVAIRNLGVRPVVLDIATAPLSIARIRDGVPLGRPDKATLVTQQVYQADGAIRTSLLVVPGRTVSIPFVFQPGATGFYMVQFDGYAHPFGQPRADKGDRWSTRAIVPVGE